MSLRFCLLLAFICLSVCIGFVSPVQASDIDVLDKQRKSRPIPLSQPTVRSSGEKDLAGQDQSIRFGLRSLSITGTTVFTPDELFAPYASLCGKQVSFNQVNEIAVALTKRYRDAGFLLSSVILPAQEVDPGGADIRFVAVEGFIAAVEYAGDEMLLRQFTAFFEPVKNRLLAKKPLQHKDFEREMLLLQDLVGMEVSSHFEAAQVPGGAVLMLKLERKPVSGSLSWGNTGTESSGPGIGSAAVTVGTLPFIGSSTNLAYTQADFFHEYHAWSVEHSHRFANGLGLSVSYAYSASPEPDSLFARLFDYETKSRTFAADLSYPLIRSRDLNLALSLGYEHRNSYADLLGERFTSDRLRNLAATLTFDFSDEWGGVTQFVPSLTRGLKIFDATDRDPEASSSLARAEYIKAGLYASRNQYLIGNWSLFTSMEAQFADSHLASYNLFSLGGNKFGRGYDPGVIEGDNAFAVNAEPRWTCYVTERAGIQLFSFIDWGSVWASERIDGMPGEENLASAGLGIRFWGHLGPDLLPDFNISAFIGKPLKRAGGDPTVERFVLQCALFF